MRTFFTFVSARIVLAQLEGSGRGALGAYDSQAAADLHHFLQDVPLKDGDEWLAQLMKRNTSLGLRLMEVRDHYCAEAFEWDHLQRIAQQDMTAANTRLMRQFAAASLAASMAAEREGPANAAAAVAVVPAAAGAAAAEGSAGAAMAAAAAPVPEAASERGAATESSSGSEATARGNAGDAGGVDVALAGAGAQSTEEGRPSAGGEGDAGAGQVEQKRHRIPRDVPCAVQQWEGLIAVNYAARAAGVTRHMRVGEAKRICPQLRTVHVETIGYAAVWEGEPGGDGKRKNGCTA
ncbi:hypothetical protein GPECTOR_4g836 [Gonium pectorale]|uniref:UmuC domain-containing protein n=1 Tax=Gonium pectorale TaxID=33097 RepID=A0A150GXX7_GONPE|nr:hypothetical protein GPECTOR_4g836 [Gonium pectorale]|eukprot:KXZ54766.1 hypothetical protein GPECTOR_4g836 [Gonium pectorale]